jgi:thiosulfate/3-mercaptopyruvate sulfurtransferase
MEMHRMKFATIITAEELVKHLGDPKWAIIDSRFKLTDPEQGRKDYEIAHIRGAVYAHLDDDLSGPVVRGKTGRHPLPSVEKARRVFSRLGVDEETQVVAYDDLGGALAAGRVWWLLRWLGHEAVAVLDGGWQLWVKEGMPVQGGIEKRQRSNFIPHPRNEMIVKTGEVDIIRQDPEFRLLDARAAQRFKGENETIDPIPGHIPGAISAPYTSNLNPDGTFRKKDSLDAKYKRLLGRVSVNNVVCYCGSGVTATHDILAMMIAGLGEARLYAGSYSEWITDPKRPVEK